MLLHSRQFNPCLCVAVRERSSIFNIFLLFLRFGWSINNTSINIFWKIVCITTVRSECVSIDCLVDIIY